MTTIMMIHCYYCHHTYNIRVEGTSRKRGFHTDPLVPKMSEPRLKGSLVAVWEATRDQRSGPSGLGRQLGDGRVFSRGCPGQPRLKAHPYKRQSNSLHLAIWCHFYSQYSQGVVGLLLVPLMHTRCSMKCPRA